MQHNESRRPKLIVGIALLALGVGLLIWSLTGRGAEAPSSNTSNSNSNTSEQRSAEDSDEADSLQDQSEVTEIVFNNDGFSPEELEVKVGSSVRVRNNSSTRVQFSSDDHPTHRINEGMNLRILAPGESASFTASEVGEWGFHDHIDASHTGTLSVVE